MELWDFWDLVHSYRHVANAQTAAEQLAGTKRERCRAAAAGQLQTSAKRRRRPGAGRDWGLRLQLDEDPRLQLRTASPPEIGAGNHTQVKSVPALVPTGNAIVLSDFQPGMGRGRVASRRTAGRCIGVYASRRFDVRRVKCPRRNDHVGEINFTAQIAEREWETWGGEWAPAQVLKIPRDHANSKRP